MHLANSACRIIAEAFTLFGKLSRYDNSLGTLKATEVIM